MDLGQKGVIWFTDALSPRQLIELAQRTEQLGYAALWYPEVLAYESFSLGSFLLPHTDRLIVASGADDLETPSYRQARRIISGQDPQFRKFSDFCDTALAERLAPTKPLRTRFLKGIALPLGTGKMTVHPLSPQR